MKITKKIDFEMAHIVRNAWSHRCSHSIHGHSYTAEITLESSQFDDGGMVLDFGLVKKFIHPFIDSFDHATMLWSEDDKEIIDLFTTKFERVIVSPFTSSCEQQARYFYWIIKDILTINRDNLPRNNKGYLSNVSVYSVKIHETKSGSALYTADDARVEMSWGVEDIKKDIRNIEFSKGITDEWPSDVKASYTSIFQN
jgi:6-pyruvoyltetrahydropterin/6-carboxytetrahydropterin synthase